MLSIASTMLLMPLQLLSMPSLAQVSTPSGDTSGSRSLQSAPLVTMPVTGVHDIVMAPVP